MSSIQNIRGISYAGAWLKYGFHEDGFTSGMTVASKYLNARPPFKIKSPERHPSFSSQTTARIWDSLEAWRIWLAGLILGPLLRLLVLLQEASEKGEAITKKYTSISKAKRS